MYIFVKKIQKCMCVYMYTVNIDYNECDSFLAKSMEPRDLWSAITGHVMSDLSFIFKQNYKW